MKYLQPQCKVCGRRGLLDQDLCAIHYKEKYREWSKEFSSGTQKHMKMVRVGKGKR